MCVLTPRQQTQKHIALPERRSGTYPRECSVGEKRGEEERTKSSPGLTCVTERHELQRESTQLPQKQEVNQLIGLTLGPQRGVGF